MTSPHLGKCFFFFSPGPIRVLAARARRAHPRVSTRAPAVPLCRTTDLSGVASLDPTLDASLSALTRAWRDSSSSLKTASPSTIFSTAAALSLASSSARARGGAASLRFAARSSIYCGDAFRYARVWASAARAFALAAILSQPGSADATHAQHQLAVAAAGVGGARAAVDCVVVTRLARAVAGARATGDAAAAIDTLASAHTRTADVDALPNLGSAFGSVGVDRIATARVEERTSTDSAGAGAMGESSRGRTTLIVAASSANVVAARRAALANAPVLLRRDTLLRIVRFTERSGAVEGGAAQASAGNDTGVLSVATALRGLTFARWALICSDCMVGDGTRARGLLRAATRDTRRLLRSKSFSSYMVYRVVVAILSARACAREVGAREVAHSILVALTTLASSHTREVIVEHLTAKTTAAASAASSPSPGTEQLAACSWLAASVEVSSRAFAVGAGPPLDLEDGRSRAMMQSLETFAMLPRRFEARGGTALLRDANVPSLMLLEDFDTHGLLSLPPPNTAPNQPAPSIAEEDAAANALSGLDLSVASGTGAGDSTPAEFPRPLGVDYRSVFVAALTERTRRVSLSLVTIRAQLVTAAQPSVRQLWHRVKRKRAREE